METFNTMRTVYLHGELAEEFGQGPFVFSAVNLADVTAYFQMRFKNKFTKRIESMMLYIFNRTEDQKNDINFGIEQLDMNLVHPEVHIGPAIDGGKGFFKAILGGLLLAVAFVGTFGIGLGLGSAVFNGALFGITGTQLSLLGAGLIVSAFAQAPTSNYADREDNASAVYSGPINTSTQGLPVPYVAGREVIVGGVVIHTAIEIEKLAV